MVQLVNKKRLRLPDTMRTTLQGCIYANVQGGAIVYTDDFSSYVGLMEDYVHETVCHSGKEFVKGLVHTNGIESVWALLKRGYLSWCLSQNVL